MSTASSKPRSKSSDSTTSKSATPLGGLLRWHKSTPRKVSAAGDWSLESDGWNAWLEHLAERKPPRQPEAFKAKRSPLLWAAPSESAQDETTALIKTLHTLWRGKKVKRSITDSLSAELKSWLAEREAANSNTALALEGLAWAYVLPLLAAHVSADLWWTLLGRLLELSEDAISLEELAPRQLLAGELPLALAWQLPEIKNCRSLATAALERLAAELEENLDGEGLPHARHLPQLRPLLACWTRVKIITTQMPKVEWGVDADTQYEWLVRNALLFTRRGGSQVFSTDGCGAWDPDLMTAALRTGGDVDDWRIASLVLPSLGGAKNGQRVSAKLPVPAQSSEWSEAAMLRPSWRRDRPWLAVTYHDRDLQVELSSGAELLLSGSWQPQLHVDDALAKLTGDWSCVCWESDADVDYLELEAQLTGGIRIQRQMLLARDDLMLLVADAVLGTEPKELEYQLPLPLADGVGFESAEETREGLLVGRKPRALVLPLGLGEWRGDRSPGKLAAESGQLVLQHRASGRHLYAPLLLDLNPRRLSKPATWRQLTVAENRHVLTPDVAVGYRAQVGSKQWVFYRSLAERGNRTLLGINLINEFLASRFHRDGTAETLIEIE